MPIKLPDAGQVVGYVFALFAGIFIGQTSFTFDPDLYLDPRPGRIYAVTSRFTGQLAEGVRHYMLVGKKGCRSGGSKFEAYPINDHVVLDLRLTRTNLAALDVLRADKAAELGLAAYDPQAMPCMKKETIRYGD